MGAEFYTFHCLPDLTLAKYSAEESGGVEDVIRQHGSFYRQMNRKGLLFREIYHLIYRYDPSLPPGKRLNVFLRADAEDAPVCMEAFMTASPLSVYYPFEKVMPKAGPVFPFCAFLAKQDGFVASSLPDQSNRFYMVNPWSSNEKARLMGLFRMMQKLQRPAAYTVTLRAVDASESMRDSFRTQMQYMRSTSKMNPGNRDENAEQCLRQYEKFFDSLRNNPHFLCQISAYAEEEALAKMILDAAASEAVEEGNYRIVCEKGEFQPLVPVLMPKEMCLSDTPRGMRRWNSLFLLKELVPFAMLPVLYPGETIEIPKESAPVYEKDGLYLGKDGSGYDVYMPLKELPKHALLAGMPGSGKTFSMLHISSQLAGEHHIPILVLEPAKKEYRVLAHNRHLPELLVFSPGTAGAFPLRINPFEFPKGLKLSEHIDNIIQVFEGAFDLTPPMPALISQGIEQVYRDHGWYSFETNDGSRSYPNIRELYDKLAELLDASDYAPEVRSNLKSCLQVRIGSLITREMGNAFDVSGSTVIPEEWLRIKCVIELESLGPDAANFLTLLLLTLIRELLRQNPKAPKEKPRHVIFLEEAHNLIGPTTVANAENGDAKVASTKYIVEMLAEVRALREAIVIADQLPTALAPQVTKNTSLKLGHRITAADDRQLLASTMSADGVQMERMGTFPSGHALCIYDGVQKPFEVKIQEYEDDSEPPDNEELFALLSGRASYQTVMRRDFQIMMVKFQTKKEKLQERYQMRFREGEILRKNAAFLAKGKDAKEEQRAKLEAQVIQHERNRMQLAVDWLEFVMEINEYVKMNVQERTEGQAVLLEELKYFMERTRILLKENPEDQEKLFERMAAGISWLSG